MTLFVWGELVFFKPAPTIMKTAKTDNPLRPGIFVDYYLTQHGKFTGQYVCCDLDDFVGVHLHHRAGPEKFHLRLHRTEVIRRPVGALEPLFPLKRRYMQSNYTVEGIEQSVMGKEDATPMDDVTPRCPPPVDADVRQGSAEPHLGTF